MVKTRNDALTTRLLLARHGQTVSSREDVFCGVTEVPLTESGHAQARRLAERLQHEQVDALYSSPQQRAHETAAPIASTLGLEIQHRSTLREMNFGVWENRSRSTIALEYPQQLALWEQGSWMARPPDGESQQEVIARAVSCLTELVERHQGQTVLIVAHKTLLRLLITHLIDMSLPASRALRVDPASLSELRITGGRVQLVHCNDTSHLSTL